MTETSAPARPRGARKFSFLLASTGVSVTGDGVLLAAAPLVAASLTREPLEIAVVAAASYAAWPLLGLPAGALVDRLPRKTVMIVADIGRAAILTLLAAVTITGHLSITGLALAVFLLGIGACFFDPAAQAMIPATIGRDPVALSRANGKIWAADTFGRSLVGPPVGAWLVGIGRSVPFLVDAGSFAISAFLLAGLPPSRKAPGNDSAVSIWRAAWSGARYLIDTKQLRVLTIGMASYNLGYNIAFSTLVLFSLDVLELGNFGYGILVAVMASGGVLGGWIAPRVAPHRSATVLYAAALAVQAMAWGATVALPKLWLVAVALALVGVASTTVSVVGGTARQTIAPDHLLGRVVAATRIVGLGSAAVGAVIGGAAASIFGISAPFILAAVVLACASAIFFAVGLGRQA